MKPRTLLLTIGACVGVVALVVVLFVLRNQRKPVLEEVTVFAVNDDLGLGVEDVESSITNPLEQQLSLLSPRLTAIRSVTTKRGTTITCSFLPPQSALDPDAATVTNDAVAKSLKYLPKDTKPPIVRRGVGGSGEKNTTLLWIAEPNVGPETTNDLEERLATLPGIASIETCGSAPGTRLVVKLDLTRMNAMGVEPQDVERAIDLQRLQIERKAEAAKAAKPPSPFDLSAAEVVRSGSKVETAVNIRIADVAMVSAVPDWSPCTMWSGSGKLVHAHLVHARADLDRKALEKMVKDASSTLEVGRAAATIRRAGFSISSMTIGAKLVAASNLIEAVTRELKGVVTVHGAILRNPAANANDHADATDGPSGEIIYTSTQADSAARLQKVIASGGSSSGIYWRGVLGDPNVHRIVVTVKRDTTDALETTASDVKKQIDKLGGDGSANHHHLGAYIGAPIDADDTPVHEELKTDRVALTNARITQRDVAKAVATISGESTFGLISIETDPPGLVRAAPLFRIGGHPLNELGSITTTTPHGRSSVLRVDRRQALELAWEVDAKESRRVFGNVKGALEGFRDVSARLVE